MTNLNNTTNLQQIKDSLHEADIVYRLLKRAEIRRSIPTRKSVIMGRPDRISELLEEAAEEIYELRAAFIESIK